MKCLHVLTALPARGLILQFQKLIQWSLSVTPGLTARIRCTCDPVPPQGAERAAGDEEAGSRKPETPRELGCGAKNREAVCPRLVDLAST